MRTPLEIETCFAPRWRLEDAKRFFLVGIGGAGMSGVARLLRARGLRVAGSDASDTPLLAELRDLGCDIAVGAGEAMIEEGDALVLSDAIALETSPEVRRAQSLRVPLFRRSQALGWILEGRRAICVTGTHGKTTTTGLAAAGMRSAGADPLVVVGAEVPEWGGSVVLGQGDWAVVEACEAYDSLRDLDPEIVVLTNLELDHVDFHGTLESLQAAILRFVDRAQTLIYCADDPGAREIASRARAQPIAYRASDWIGPDLRLSGEHNRSNAAGALAACVAAGVDPEVARAGVAGFGGAARRLQTLREGPIVVVDDYAHTPREIEASIGAIRERYPGRRVLVAYQPHLYSRTDGQYAAFARALDLADEVFLTDIYPAREAPMPGVSSARVAELTTRPHRYVPSRHLLPREVASRLRGESGWVVVGMGAGTIESFAPELLAELDRVGTRRVAVLLGGDSAEREVSLHSGLAILAALRRRGYEAFPLDLSELLLSGGDLGALTGPRRPDLAFLAVHGTHAEDGAIQGALELLHLPYTGSGPLASALAFDKDRAKRILAAAGVEVPRGELIRAPGPAPFPGPWVVKPNRQGSTVGLGFVEHEADLDRAVERALAYDESALVEEWVRGVEISIPVLADRALPAVEIVPAKGRYDFAAKYVPGATEEIVPARLPPRIADRAADIALAAHRALGCEGATRTDMIVDGERVVVLEVNTLPGMTPTSLLPRSAEAAGIDFDALCAWIVEDALGRAVNR